MCKPAQLHLLVPCPTVSHLRCPAQRVVSSSWCHFLSTLLHTLLSSLHLSSSPTCILASPLCPPPPPLLSPQAFIFRKQMFSAPYGREFLFLSVMKSQAKFDLLKNKQGRLHTTQRSQSKAYMVLSSSGWCQFKDQRAFGFFCNPWGHKSAQTAEQLSWQ